MSEQQKLLNAIQKYDFTLYELTLYLDTHPDCKQALDFYHKYKKLYNDALNEYMNNYGPLNAAQVINTEHWSWIDAPWPWERSMD